MVLLIPPGAGYDEEDHLVRVWELSAFSFIPGGLSPQEMKYPTLFRDFTYRQQGSNGVLGSDFWQKYSGASLYQGGFVHREIKTKSVYSPALLLPQAMTMRLLGRSAELPVLPVFYVCRFASLVSYMILAWLALRWMPYGKRVLFVLAASPIALFQAATISPDAISNGIGFLFIAGCLSIAESPNMGWKEAGTTIFLASLLFLGKLNLLPLILLPFLLIAPSKFIQKRIYVALLVIIASLFVIEVIGWNAIASRHSDPLLTNEANPAAQLLYIAGHPFAFTQTLMKDFISNGWIYLQSWINGYGYYYWTPPLVVSFFFLLSLVAVRWVDSTSEQVNSRSRLVFILVFIAGYLATIVSLYLTFTPVGSNQVFGVQGRYFVVLGLLFFLVVFSFGGRKKNTMFSPKWMITFLSIALFLNIAGIFLSFHVPCGATFYQTGLCYRPLFKDFPSGVGASPSISTEISLTQEIKVSCNGLAEIRLLLIPPAQKSDGSTRFVLQDAVNNQILLDRSVANDQIAVDDWYSLDFEPDWHSEGKQYLLKISSADPAAVPGIKLLYTTQPELNLGNLYENEQSLEEDIVLQYGCATGLRKFWLTGKPQKP